MAMTTFTRELCYDEWKKKNPGGSEDEFQQHWEGLAAGVKGVSETFSSYPDISHTLLFRLGLHETGEESM